MLVTHEGEQPITSFSPHIPASPEIELYHQRRYNRCGPIVIEASFRCRTMSERSVELVLRAVSFALHFSIEHGLFCCSFYRQGRWDLTLLT